MNRTATKHPWRWTCQCTSHMSIKLKSIQADSMESMEASTANLKRRKLPDNCCYATVYNDDMEGLSEANARDQKEDACICLTAKGG